MPRNNGNYTLPQPAFVSGTKISSFAMNSDLSDIAAALTQSISADGQTPITGQILFLSGTAASPGISFGADKTTGINLPSPGQLGFSASGADVLTWNGTTWTFTGGVTVSGAFSIGSLTVSNGATIGTTLSVAGKASFTSTDSMAIANGTTGQRNGTPSAGDFRFNSTLSCFEGWNGSAWVQLGTPPTVQRFTSGSSQTYTPTTGVVRIKVRMCGGGAGGSGNQGQGAGNPGGTTSFGSWTAVGGTGPVANGAGGAGGTGGTNGTGTLVLRVNGGGGAGSEGAANLPGTQGGVNPFGGAGTSATGALSGAPAANSGAGGGGGGGGSSANGGGGGAGEYVEFWVNGPSATTYTVGGGGSGGISSGINGTAGAAGIIIIEEFYF